MNPSFSIKKTFKNFSLCFLAFPSVFFLLPAPETMKKKTPARNKSSSPPSHNTTSAKRTRRMVEIHQTPSPCVPKDFASEIKNRNTKDLQGIAKQEVRNGRRSMMAALQTALSSAAHTVEVALTDIERKTDVQAFEHEKTALSSGARTQVDFYDITQSTDCNDVFLHRFFFVSSHLHRRQV